MTENKESNNSTIFENNYSVSMCSFSIEILSYKNSCK